MSGVRYVVSLATVLHLERSSHETNFPQHICHNVQNIIMSNLLRPRVILIIVRPGGPYLSPDLPRGQKSISPAIDLVGRVLREQGLGRHIDDDFIAAATTEMQEAMNMTPAEFEAAAAQLLAAENEGAFR